MPKRFKPTIAVDFDGVIAQLSAAGTFVPKLDETQPIEGARAAIAALVDHGYQVIVYTARANSKDSRADVILWLNQYDIPYHDVTNVKPPAIAYIDDRAIKFDNWPQTMAEIGKLNVIEILNA